MAERNSIENEQDNGPKYVEIPRGWNRILENGSILYISPSSSRLRCRDQVIDYLKAGGTCKCGLECPLHVDKVFIFDAQVPSKLTNQNADCPKSPSSCKHCEGNAAQKEKPLQRYTAQTSVSPLVEQKNESEKDPKLPPLAKGASGQKKGSARSRKGALDVNKQQPKISMQTSLQMKKELAPPTHSICSPISNPLGSMTEASPVQNVPTNLATSNQGPLPSFASIISSSKFFNPGLEATPPIGNPLVSSGLPTTCTIPSGVKASSTISSTARSVQNSVPRTVTKYLKCVVTSASNVKPKTAQRMMSKNVAVSKNLTVSKSGPTTVMTANSVKVTPRTNVPVTTAAMTTKNVLVAVPSNIGSASAVAMAQTAIAGSTPISTVLSSSLLSTTPTYTTVVSSPVSISLASSVAPRTSFVQTSSLSSARTGTTSSMSALTAAAAAKVVACSSISATMSTAATVGSRGTSFVSPMVVVSKSVKGAASPAIITSKIATTGTFASQNVDPLKSIVSKQPVNTKATAKSAAKPAARSRVAKPRTTAASKKQGLKALANAAGLVSAKIPANATNIKQITSFGSSVSAGVANPVLASSVQSSVLKTAVPPSSVIAPVMTPTLWNPALMSKYGQSSQQSQSQSYVSGTWSTVLSPNVISSLPGLRHPPPSATAPTIVSTAIPSVQHRVEVQSTAASATAASTASTFTTPTASIAHTLAPSSRTQLSQLPNTSVSIPIVSTSSQRSFNASTSQTQSASQGSVAQVKGQLLTAQNIFSQSHVTAGANPAVVSAVPQVQPAIVAPIPSNVFYQGAAVNQMYNPQSVDVNQLKALGQYQVQWPALYPGQLAANTMAVLTTGQEKGSTTPVANVNQQGYPNPFMFGIIMPTAQPGGVSATSSTGSSVSSTMTSSVTSTAVAAAYGSYVPIAPAATPRFSQTLAHLANAYNPYGTNLREVAPSNNQLQFTYRMMQMSAFASGGMGNNLPLGGGVGAPTPSVSDYSLKYPLNTVKQMSYGAAVSSVSTTTAHSSMVKTPVSAALQTPAQTVVAAMPYVPMTTQVGNAQHPSAFSSPATPMGAPTRTSVAASGPYTYGMMTAAANIDPKTGNTTFGYLFIPPTGDMASSSGSEASVISAPTSDSCVTTAETTVTASLSALTRGVQNQGASQGLNPKTSAVGCVNPSPASPSTSSLCLGSSSALTTSSPTLWTPWSTTTTGVVHGAANSNPVTSLPLLPSQTNSTTSPMHTIFSPTITPHTTAVTDNTRSMSNQSPQPYAAANIHGVKGDTKSRESPLSISPTVKTSVPYENSKSPLADPKGQKRSYFDDVSSDKRNSNNEKRRKYDFRPSSFVETDPLLGMKRSCEAIEVYPIRKDSNKKKCNDNENCGEGNRGEGDEDGDDDHPSEVTETRDAWKDGCSAVSKTADVKGSSPGATKLPSSTSEPELRLSESEAQNGEVEESQHGDLSKLSDIGPDGIMTKLGDPTGLVDCLPAPQVRPHFGTGDVVWAQARGLPSWPGKIVDESEAGRGRPDDGKRWVMWFGDHTFSQVEVDRFKTLSEGLRSLDDKGKKKKYRARKARISLEQAISEALEELENREQLNAKQAGKTKAKKKRVR